MQALALVKPQEPHAMSFEIVRFVMARQRYLTISVSPNNSLQAEQSNIHINVQTAFLAPDMRSLWWRVLELPNTWVHNAHKLHAYMAEWFREYEQFRSLAPVYVGFAGTELAYSWPCVYTSLMVISWIVLLNLVSFRYNDLVQFPCITITKAKDGLVYHAETTHQAFKNSLIISVASRSVYDERMSLSESWHDWNIRNAMNMSMARIIRQTQSSRALHTVREEKVRGYTMYAYP